MKGKHLRQRVESCVSLSKLSVCPKRQFGCLILDQQRNVVISEGYNGTLRGAKGKLCAGDTCQRQQIVSGTQLEIGCVHAEQNAIYNAARMGVSVEGMWLFINGEPCEMCAKAMVQVGIERVFCVNGGYTSLNGLHFLETHNIPVHQVNLDTDFDALLEDIFDSMFTQLKMPTLASTAAKTPFSKI